jgi:hypothetical protein
MSNIFQGSLETSDGVIHSSAVARLYQTNITDDPIHANSKADILIYYYHDEASMDAGKSPIRQNAYHFIVGGQHPFETIFIAGQNIQQNLFNYLAARAEFAGWTLYSHLPV